MNAHDRKPPIELDGACVLYRVLFVVGSCLVMALSAALASQVMFWMVFIPLLLAAAVATAVVLVRLESCLPSARGTRAVRVGALLAIICGALGVAASSLLVNWPLRGLLPGQPQPLFSWSIVGVAWPHLLIWPGLAALGVRLRARCPWPVAALVFLALACVLPLKLWW